MYIPQFLAGILSTIGAELIVLIVAAIIIRRKKQCPENHRR